MRVWVLEEGIMPDNVAFFISLAVFVVLFSLTTYIAGAGDRRRRKQQLLRRMEMEMRSASLREWERSKGRY